MLAILLYQNLEAFVTRTTAIPSPVKMNALELSKHSAISAMSVLLLRKRPTGQNDAMRMHILFFGTPTTPERKTVLQEKYVIHTVCIFNFDTYLEIVIIQTYVYMYVYSIYVYL